MKVVVLRSVSFVITPPTVSTPMSKRVMSKSSRSCTCEDASPERVTTKKIPASRKRTQEAVPHTEAVFSIVKKIYEREPDGPMEDLDVNAAVWGIFLNATLQAAVHVGQNYEENLRFAKNHLWSTAEQLFNETGKLIRDPTEITGVTTIDFKELTWRSTSLLCSRAYQITKCQNLHLLRLGALYVGKMGDDPTAAWKNKN